jgi:hypothetical protein
MSVETPRRTFWAGIPCSREETTMRADEASVAAGVLDVEMAGAEPIPADRRHGRPRSLFTL